MHPILKQQLKDWYSKKGKPKKKVKSKPKTKANHSKGLKYYDYLKTDYWAKVRAIKLRQHNYECAFCSSKRRLVVHHTSYKNKGNELNHLDDLIVLCNDCHQIEHGKHETQKTK